MKSMHSRIYWKKKYNFCCLPECLFNMNRMHINETCDSERTTSLVKHYIPSVKLSGQRENELRYILPSEHVNKFPGNYQVNKNEFSYSFLKKAHIVEVTLI